MMDRFETYCIFYYRNSPILKILGQFENLGFVIMSTRENIRLIARAPFTVETSGTGVRIFKCNMKHVARKRFFGVHAPDPPACVPVDTETNTSLFILGRQSL